MIPKFKKQFLLFLFMLVFLPYRIVFADTGPKPTMEFTFEQAGGLTITSGILYECHQPDCSDAEPLKELGPQRFTCDTTSCSALSYGFSPYHKIEIQFSDGKTRQSNIFETAGFNSTYKVTVRETDLLVEAKFTLSPIITFLLVCSCILVFGILSAVFFFFVIRRLKKK